MKRETYIDNIKVLACLLVVAGHLVKSMIEAGFMEETPFINTGLEILYCFHVNLFFMCSGYLYQRYSKIDTLKAYGVHVLHKLKILGVPYFVFSSITIALKHLAKGSVNSEAGGYIHTLFVSPASPYWYLYAVFFMFILIPVIRNRWQAVLTLILSVVMMVTYWTKVSPAPDVIYFFMNYSCWFVLGMFMGWGNIASYVKGKTAGPALAILGFFTALMLYEWCTAGMFFSYIRQVMSLLICLEVMIFSILIFKGRKQPVVLGFLSKYTMAIFLMHTIFASGTRMVLGRLHITGLPAQMGLGLIAGVLGPVLVWMLLDAITRNRQK